MGILKDKEDDVAFKTAPVLAEEVAEMLTVYASKSGHVKLLVEFFETLLAEIEVIQDTYNEIEYAKGDKNGFVTGVARAAHIVEKQAADLFLERKDDQANKLRTLAGQIRDLTAK